MFNGSKVFLQEGIYGKKGIDYKTDEVILKRWREARTGMPLIDALMRELN
jgi:deoxyribodipyrimidine photolyase